MVIFESGLLFGRQLRSRRRGCSRSRQSFTLPHLYPHWSTSALRCFRTPACPFWKLMTSRRQVKNGDPRRTPPKILSLKESQSILEPSRTLGRQRDSRQVFPVEYAENCACRKHFMAFSYSAWALRNHVARRTSSGGQEDSWSRLNLCSQWGFWPRL